MQVNVSPVGSRSLDKSVVTLTGVIWLAHLLTMLTVSRAIGANIDAGATMARIIASASGIAITLTMYLLLRSIAPTRPWRPFFAAAALSIPACAIQTFVNELAFHELALSYRVDPAKWLNFGEMAFTFLFFFWVFIAWSALYAGAANALQVLQRDRELAAARSSAQESLLLALRLQISPHFLFNTLNTLSGLTVLGRKDDSELIIQNLSGFLRYTLDSTPSQLVTLADEIRVQLLYLDIERARFPDRLHVRTEIPASCGTALVPSLILLPLVENAIKHGLGESEGEVEVSIGAKAVSGKLIVWVAHDGGVFPSHARGGLQIGLRNVRERIAASFGPDATLDAGVTEIGWQSTITIPWMEHAP